MPTLPTHALVAGTMLAPAARRPIPRSIWWAGVICAILPDIDVIGFRFGVSYGDLLGHRGLTHSIAFAAALAGIVTVGVRRSAGPMSSGTVWRYLFFCTLSHGVLDGATNGGLGIAFFSPFSNTRYFWPWRPIAVSPIGIRFFSPRGVSVIFSELQWIWLPCLVVLVLCYAGKNEEGRLHRRFLMNEQSQQAVHRHMQEHVNDKRDDV